MNKVLETSFYTMCKKYNLMLKDFYPARGSTGFTESNQVHIYVNSLVKELNDDFIIEWLEFPWVDKKQHIDAMVYSPKHKTIFYIEAKRFSHQSKKQSLARDINRLINDDKSFIKEYNIKDIKNQYIIALSDIWLETTWKKNIKKWWQNNCEDSFENLLKNAYAVDWSDASKYYKELDSVKNYALLMGCKKI
ncbi:MAG: hypothetical protein A2513_10090 [Sulfurimonas sp. RIFOXYD12_FULL_33_39]|uniref:hypothetical protein n=1 Tax=unclassified Sulfurimonas TaxID=2623549 RepID=UPI0008B363FE|nr:MULTISPECIES: hypothetical protein [unclassified Sulfurimonas]OHE09662.1 MAG: hypothetical protein A2513_10090 [Sulfurimonas sp. RIFOXYD12_FULL_33_39]OHE13830.1 MAG: hypothetical protein A2530_09665 [Sulfurimonas sp. RIFOXYD2_FULL_34_21]